MEPRTSSVNASFLEELRKRRGEMRDSISALELALAAPAAQDQARWTERVQTALVELSGDLRQHVEITEGVDGLYQEVRAEAPRLADRITRLTTEHEKLRGQIDSLIAQVDSTHDLEHVTIVRDLGTELLMTLVRHRQRGADLVYEAYEFDIGGDT